MATKKEAGEPAKPRRPRPKKVPAPIQEVLEAPTELPKQSQWDRIKGWKYFKIAEWAAIALAALIVALIAAKAMNRHNREVKAETQRRKEALLNQLIKVVNTKIAKQDTVVLTDKRTAEYYHNDRVAFEQAIKTMREIDVKQHRAVYDQVDSTNNDDALRALLDSLSTIQ